MVRDSFTQFKFKKQLEEIKSKRSQDGSTCLVTLYIPTGRVLSDFTTELSNEVGTAANIKSKQTRKNVISSLQVIIGKLKRLGQKAPASGFAMFSGVTTSGKNEFFLVSPPEPITRKLYICDLHFYTDFLEEALIEKDTFGLITIDASDATVATLRGSQLEILKQTRSGIASKHRAGGQSAARFARLREEQVQRFLKRVADFAKHEFIEKSVEIKGLVIGGPGYIKEKSIDLLDNKLKEKILKVIDIGYSADQQGMRELVTKAKDVLEGVRYVEEKKLVDKWMELIYPGMATYGESEIRQLLNQGVVDTLLLSEKLADERITVKCPSCGHSYEKTVRERDLEKFEEEINQASCIKCSSSLLDVVSRQGLVENLGELVSESGAKVEVISAETDEGMQLYNFGGVGAILRYKVDL